MFIKIINYLFWWIVKSRCAPHDCDASLKLAQKQVQYISQTCKSKSDEVLRTCKSEQNKLPARKCDQKEVCDLQEQ